MMLQTLVENGIKHGVSKLTKGGSVEVIAALEENALLIKIRNTGNLGATDSGGVGLLNTAERLSILYGKDAYFKIYQESEDLVCAEIRVPTLSDGMQRYNGEAPTRTEVL